jgi:hypothetical protein
MFFMSPNNDRCHRFSLAPRREVIDCARCRALACQLHLAGVRMHPLLTSLLLLAPAVLAGSLVGALLVFSAKRRVRRPAPRVSSRSAVQLALRLARLGQRTMLVETSGGGVRVARLDEAARGPRLQYVASIADGALILARQHAP